MRGMSAWRDGIVDSISVRCHRDSHLLFLMVPLQVPDGT